MKAPNPGKGWRLLKVGETVIGGDEFSSWGGAWSPVMYGGRLAQTTEANGFYYRRKLDANHYRLVALRMSKAKTIREAREIYRKAVGK